VSEVLARLVGVLSIKDIKIVETNTDDIVREIYKSGSSEANRSPEGDSEGESGNGDASGEADKAGQPEGAVSHA
jgi:ABC-2 type transport system ATP-binding protein